MAEATVIGLVVPALWWFDRRFLATRWARAAIVALLVTKAAGLLLTPQGLCARFSTTAPFTGEIATIGIDEPSGALRSWDVRADWRADRPACTAIVDRPYRIASAFPAWWVNLVDFIRPGRRDLALDLSGHVRVTEAGTFSLAAGDDMTLAGTIGDRTVSAAAGATLEAPLERGMYPVTLHATLTGERWSLVPLWNGHDAWSSVTFTTGAPGLIDRAAPGISLLTTLLTLAIVIRVGRAGAPSAPGGMAAPDLDAAGRGGVRMARDDATARSLFGPDARGRPRGARGRASSQRARRVSRDRRAMAGVLRRTGAQRHRPVHGVLGRRLAGVPGGRLSHLHARLLARGRQPRVRLPAALSLDHRRSAPDLRRLERGGAVPGRGVPPRRRPARVPSGEERRGLPGRPPGGHRPRSRRSRPARSGISPDAGSRRSRPRASRSWRRSSCCARAWGAGRRASRAPSSRC